MLDQGVPDEKILAYATGNPRFGSIQNYTDVQPHILLEGRTLLSIYKDLEGKRTKVLGWKDRDAAHAIIQSSHQRFPAKDARLVGAISE
jgi:inorganic pyrophosphatase